MMNANESLSRVGPVLRARGLEKEYGQGEGLVRALDGVELEVASGETLAVMGPSGCGKSTLLHLLGGLERPSAGEVWLAGRRIDQLSEKALARLRRQAIGFVFQAFHLMDELTAVENVELPALLAGRSPRAARHRAAAIFAPALPHATRSIEFYERPQLNGCPLGKDEDAPTAGCSVRIVWAATRPSPVCLGPASGRGQDVYTVSADGTGLTQITYEGAADGTPDWGTYPPTP
jgi:hypothetical protein